MYYNKETSNFEETIYTKPKISKEVIDLINKFNFNDYSKCLLECVAEAQLGVFGEINSNRIHKSLRSFCEKILEYKRKTVSKFPVYVIRILKRLRNLFPCASETKSLISLSILMLENLSDTNAEEIDPKEFIPKSLEDFIMNRMVYNASRCYNQTRITVCRKLKDLSKKRYNLTDRQSSIFALRLEELTHKAFFFDETQYKKAIVSFVRHIDVNIISYFQSQEFSNLTKKINYPEKLIGMYLAEQSNLS